jgi:hypothetical protein
MDHFAGFDRLLPVCLHRTTALHLIDPAEFAEPGSATNSAVAAKRVNHADRQSARQAAADHLAIFAVGNSGLPNPVAAEAMNCRRSRRVTIPNVNNAIASSEPTTTQCFSGTAPVRAANLE